MDCTDPKTMKKMKWIFGILTIIFAILSLFISEKIAEHGHFFFTCCCPVDGAMGVEAECREVAIDGQWYFATVYSLLACCVLVVVSTKVFGPIFKREDTYYND